MYQVTVKGRNLDELKKAVSDIASELNDNVKVVSGLSKDLTEMYGEPTEPVKEEQPELKEAEVVINHVEEVKVDTNQELDVRGLPWDARIHAAKKTKNADGSWRNRRGVDRDLLAKVEAELKNVYASITDSASHIVEPSTPVTPVLPTSAPVVETPVAPATIAPPPVQQPVTSGHSLQTFKQNFPMVLSQLISEGKITQDYVNQLCGHFGVSAIYEISEDQKEELFISFANFGFIDRV